MSSRRAVLTVSQLTEQLRGVVEERFPAVWVEGEVSNFRLYGSGHAYFTLKDEGAQLRAVLFRNRMRRLRFEPGDGQHLLAFGSLEVYAQRGEYQFVVELLEPRGLGALQLAFEQLKQRLGAEGLFDPGRKRALPRFPRKIGIATSPSGAAVRDLLRVIGRRFAGLSIVVAPCRVQGEGAAQEIAEAIGDLNALGDVDVIIVGRGGGSLEDLWAFNEEAVARAIAGSKVPVVSAVGHEVDVTIADFVADVRAATPSNAAELVVREKQAVADTLAALQRRLERAVARPLDHLARRVDDARARLALAGTARHGRLRHRLELLGARLQASSPFARLASHRHRLDRAQSRLGGLVASRLTDDRHRLDRAQSRLGGLVTSELTTSRHRLERAQSRLDGLMTQRLTTNRHRLGAVAGRLDSLSPLAVLSRGYSLTRSEDGAIVRRAGQVNAGDVVNVLLHEGSLMCRVERTRERDDRPQV